MQSNFEIPAILRFNETADNLLLNAYKKRSNNEENEEWYFQEDQVESFSKKLKPGNVIELNGSSNTGKTEFLLELIARILLPGNKYNNQFETEVLFIDNDSHFDISRLAYVCEQKMNDHSAVNSCLEKIHILRPQNSFEFLVSLKALERFLHERPQIRFLFIDSISSFFLLDKQEIDQGKSVHQRIIKQLRTLTARNDLILILTHQILFKTSQTDYFGLAFKDFVNSKFLFEQTKNSFCVSSTQSNNKFSFSFNSNSLIVFK